MKIWEEKIHAANLGLQILAQGDGFRAAMEQAGLTCDASFFAPAIDNDKDAEIALLKVLTANQHGLINELSK